MATNEQDAFDTCEQLVSSDIRKSFISGVNFEEKEVTYAAVDGMAIFEGCIVLGTVEQMEQIKKQVEDPESVTDISFGIGITGESSRWKDCLVPFALDANFPDPQRAINAIAHWEEKTPMIFRPRTSQPDFITYRSLNGCFSNVGKIGGNQTISLGAGCGLGQAIHETGHAVGLWHEQSREDRNNFIQVVFSNIQPNAVHNFNQHITDGDDIGSYDFGSIMHYGSNFFAIDPTKPTIIAPQPVGQRNGLSLGDVDAIRNMYSRKLDMLVHLENIGDRGGIKAGVFGGTRGQSRRLEGFQLQLDETIPNLGLEYMAHLQNIGDVPFVPGGQFVGTRGQSRRLEGFAIRLTGTAAKDFDIFYMAHLQGIGDTAVFSNGEFCGTRGQSRRVEGLSVWLLKKFEGNLRGLVHLQGIGDVVQPRMKFAGTRGQSRRLEGFQLNFDPPIPGVGLRYMAHLQNIGDVPFVTDGQFVGTRGQSRRLEGFAIELTGPNAKDFDVFYMAHLEGIGDTQVFSNGQFCGTRGQSRRVEGMRVWVMRKQ